MRLFQARAKIGRANTHIQNLEWHVKALEETDTAIVDLHPMHGTEVLTHTLDDGTFNDIALVVGDAVHNLNCALDYTWLETITVLVPVMVRDKAKFPVYRAIEEVQGAMRSGNIHTICPALFSFMADEIKPCDGGNAAIWPIHNFANRDKHRLLIPVLAEGTIDGIEVQDEMGNRYPGSGMSSAQRPPYCIQLDRGLHFTKKGKLSANIVVEDGKFGCVMNIPETLFTYSRAIVCVVKAFESFLEVKGF